MGDPETEAVIPRIESDLLDLLEGVANQKLHEKDFRIKNETAATVVMVSGGYPGDYKKGLEVNLPQISDSLIFHSGTIQHGEAVKTAGGRVFAVTSFGKKISEAVSKSLNTASQIQFEGKYFRKDIGKDLQSL